MSLASYLEDGINGQGRGGNCTLGLVLPKLGDRDRVALEEAMTDPSVQSSVIARALDRAGYSVRAYTVARHRRRECRCPA